ncbi:hypothetical protein OSTOST_04323, partial [Ostertagia ostertagi]
MYEERTYRMQEKRVSSDQLSEELRKVNCRHLLLCCERNEAVRFPSIELSSEPEFRMAAEWRKLLQIAVFFLQPIPHKNRERVEEERWTRGQPPIRSRYTPLTNERIPVQRTIEDYRRSDYRYDDQGPMILELSHRQLKYPHPHLLKYPFVEIQ